MVSRFLNELGRRPMSFYIFVHCSLFQFVFKPSCVSSIQNNKIRVRRFKMSIQVAVINDTPLSGRIESAVGELVQQKLNEEFKRMGDDLDCLEYKVSRLENVMVKCGDLERLQDKFSRLENVMVKYGDLERLEDKVSRLENVMVKYADHFAELHVKINELTEKIGGIDLRDKRQRLEIALKDEKISEMSFTKSDVFLNKCSKLFSFVNDPIKLLFVMKVGEFIQT